MSDPFTTAPFSMGYTSPQRARAPVRRIAGPALETPGNDRQWWEAHLASSVSAGLGDLEWYPSDDDGIRYWGVVGQHDGRSVSIRLARSLEHRGSETVTDEVMTNVELRVTPPRLGLWVLESPPKWFRGRRAWALNRPPFSTGDPWFDEHAGCWAWDCTKGPEALRDALAPLLPALRGLLDTHPGAIITNTTISVWIPYTEVPERLSRLLAMAQLIQSSVSVTAIAGADSAVVDPSAVVGRPGAAGRRGLASPVEARREPDGRYRR